MSWRQWAEQLRQSPATAVAALLRGSADISPFDRVDAHEFLLAVLPRSSRLVSQTLLGEPASRADDACAAQQVEQHGFNLIVAVMRQRQPVSHLQFTPFGADAFTEINNLRAAVYRLLIKTLDLGFWPVVQHRP